jgi:hypothetical protein
MPIDHIVVVRIDYKPMWSEPNCMPCRQNMSEKYMELQISYIMLNRAPKVILLQGTCYILYGQTFALNSRSFSDSILVTNHSFTDRLASRARLPV